MASRELETVVAHLRALAARSAAAGAAGTSPRPAQGPIHPRRLTGHVPRSEPKASEAACVDEYADVDPSVRRFDADVQRVEITGVPCEWLRAAGADPDRRLLYIHGDLAGLPARTWT